jgi:hypothetical protein
MAAGASKSTFCGSSSKRSQLALDQRLFRSLLPRVARPRPRRHGARRWRQRKRKRTRPRGVSRAAAMRPLRCTGYWVVKDRCPGRRAKHPPRGLHAHTPHSSRHTVATFHEVCCSRAAVCGKQSIHPPRSESRPPSILDVNAEARGSRSLSRACSCSPGRRPSIARGLGSRSKSRERRR